jgi:bifunctional DNA-binding transcriptional regulator/antitoxin component of YhaV-PrlF toxin-antitoxin module
MLAKSSFKGRLVIAKPVRESLGVQRGAQFHVRLEAGEIVPEPVGPSPAEALYGRYADVDFLTVLEEEHRQET